MCLWPLTASNPHLRANYTWELTRTVDGAVIGHITTPEPPSIETDLCRLFGETWNKPESDIHYISPVAHGAYHMGTSYGCGTLILERGLWRTQHYVCPAEGSPECGTDGDYYCAQWGCETMALWTNRDPAIRFKRIVRPGAPSNNCMVGDCNPIVITPQNWWEKYWDAGKTWGLRLYVAGRDPGVLFTLQRTQRIQKKNPIGPLRPLDQGLPPVQPLRPRPTPPPPARNNTELTPLTKVSVTLVPKTHTTKPGWRPILDTLDAVFNFLNQTSPNATRDCWLCLNPEPPYYVGIGANATVGSNSSDIRNVSITNPPQGVCRWGQTPKLTLGDFQGQGTCVMSSEFDLSKSPYGESCSSVLRFGQDSEEETDRYLVAPEGTWFACTTGITPCVSPLTLMHPRKPSLCILAHILPQVYYYSGEGGREHLGLAPGRIRRAPVIIPLLVGLGITGSAAIGTTALVTGDKNFKELSSQVDLDLSTLEENVNRLEDSLSSLAEVVLQNRRGLDLLFMKQGGLCMALGETCCFYTNHSGVIRESLSQLRKRLQDREERQRTEGNWYENLFSWSPWLTTLLTSLAGPLILLLIAATFGPCLINSLTNYVKRRIQAVKLMVLRTHYHHVCTDDGETMI
ncbi:endogenous retrovirus group S71 member 1 Env polyprotein-like [Eptesicus fuscus]|uniref:endogenous retrovirus group S71 member 1 Env polyprotein-like n=1 Tax=Eptesicus fuscus TaxID=29078 RepID=UPI002404133B|nr:endogenous retrovirus group S71 member 1 Env polyprotein-like [Eptesicus fuscus]